MKTLGVGIGIGIEVDIGISLLASIPIPIPTPMVDGSRLYFRNRRVKRKSPLLGYPGSICAQMARIFTRRFCPRGTRLFILDSF